MGLRTAAIRSTGGLIGETRKIAIPGIADVETVGHEDEGGATKAEPPADDLTASSRSGTTGFEEASFKWRSWWFTTASVGLLGVAVAVYHQPLLVALIVLGALFTSAVPLRGPAIPHCTINQKIRIATTALLFSAEALAVTGYVQLQFVVPYYEMPGPISTILVATFGICALGIILGLGVTWMSRNRWVEPLCLAAVTIALGAMTFAGLRPYMAVTSYPFVEGSALLYINANPSYPATLEADVSPLPTSGSSVDLTIKNQSLKHSVKWALLLVGDAWLKHITSAPRQSSYRLLSNIEDGLNDQSSFEGPAQLLWGSLQPARQERISGYSNVPYMAVTPSRTTVTFPRFGEGYFMQGTNRATMAAINMALNGRPEPRVGGRFTVDVSSPANPVVVETDPTPMADTDDPATGLKELMWTDHEEVTASFMTFDQTSDDETRNALLVYAALLGMAGAGLLVSIQSAIHLVGSRE
jgi:hypothetical protein